VAEAVSLYEKLIPSYPIRRRVGWETTRAYFARALNAVGAHARAKAVAEEVLSNMLPSDHELAAHFLEAQRQLSLAESGLGNHARAALLLDELLAKHGQESNALLVGLLHQARAEVARRANDHATAEVHRAEMETRFRRTHNPALIAQCERARRSTAALAAVRPREVHQPLPNTVSAFSRAVAPTLPSQVNSPSGLSDLLAASDEPLETALQLLIRQTKAKRAYLYVPAGDELQLAWSSTKEEAPDSCLEELARWVEVVRENDGDDASSAGRSTVVVETVTVSGYRMVALCRPMANTVLGGLILEAESKIDLIGSSELFDELGRIVEGYGSDGLNLITA
jgi:hypothetical protein